MANPLVTLRRKAGLPNSDAAAKALGVKAITVKSIESGRLTPSWALLARMIAAYGISEKQLRFELRRAKRNYHKRDMARP